MDDFNVSSLHESKNEWCASLLVILTPLIIEGFPLKTPFHRFLDCPKLPKTVQNTHSIIISTQNYYIE